MGACWPSPHVTSQELKGLKEGEDPEDGPGEEGVTFDVWKKTELPPPLEPVFDEVHSMVQYYLRIGQDTCVKRAIGKAG